MQCRSYSAGASIGKPWPAPSIVRSTDCGMCFLCSCTVLKLKSLVPAMTKVGEVMRDKRSGG